jgi:membrane fusion protein (multidrug efflux system)
MILARIDQNTLTQAEANYTLADRNYQRALNFLSEGVIDQRSFDDIENHWKMAKTAFDTANDNLVVRAPFSGVIAAVNFRENENYSPMNPQGLFRLVNDRRSVVETNVTDSDAAILKRNNEVRIIADGNIFEGYISFISPENDKMTGLNRVKIEFRNQRHELRNNQFVTLEIVPDFRDDVLLIPKVALISTDQVILNVNDTARFRTVRTGMENRQLVEIVSGLAAGDMVIIEGVAGLEDGYPLILFTD